jgi:hypothetical protein
MPPKKRAKRGRPKETARKDERRSSLPNGVIAVAAMNNRSRMFVPGVDNTFAGISFPHVMIDSGCNSLLIPFPEDISILDPFAGTRYAWTVSTSSGTGATSSPTLTIKSKLLPSIGEMKLSLMSSYVPLPRLRFHVTKQAAQLLLRKEKIDDNDKNVLRAFLDAVGDGESKVRTHVLLGQLILASHVSVQSNPVFMICDKSYDGPLQEDLNAVWEIVKPLVDTFDNFHDLVDEDHDGDDYEGNVCRGGQMTLMSQIVSTIVVERLKQYVDSLPTKRRQGWIRIRSRKS